MRVFVAGATGAIGTPLVHRLVEAGHEVTGTTRSPERAEAVRAAGAEPLVVDAFDTDGLRRAIESAAPDVVVNQLTALSAPLDPRRYGEWLAETNRMRAELGPLIVEAAREAGARRVVAQSISFLAAPDGLPVVDEKARPWTDAPEPFATAVRSALALEDAVVAAGGVVLRYGYFYGPGTAYGPGGGSAEQARIRRLPIVGRGKGRFSFIHVDDAAAATVLALDRGEPGVYNVVDDDPAPMREWLPAFAEAAGAPRPRRVPAFVVRLAAGPALVAAGTRQPGASNAKARRELGFEPRFPSWREGFRAVFAAPRAA